MSAQAPPPALRPSPVQVDRFSAGRAGCAGLCDCFLRALRADPVNIAYLIGRLFRYPSAFNPFYWIDPKAGRVPHLSLFGGPERSMRKSEMLRKATQTKSTPSEYHPLKVDLIGCQVFFLPRQHVSVAHQFTPDGGTGRKQPKHAEKYRFCRKTGTAASVRGKIDCNKMRALLREGHLEAMFYLRTHTHTERDSYQCGMWWGTEREGRT